MAMSQAIDITPEQRELIVSLLSRHLPDTEAWAYGSRVRWTYSPESDLDMVVLTPPEQARAVSNLRDEFEEQFAELRNTLTEVFSEPETLDLLIQQKLEEIGSRG